MFKKILIANRGEIACRAMRTAKNLGIRTVAVYSTADAKARHVREADEAVLIGNPPPGESYLLIDKLIDACRSTGADAVYPGYGFLSENAEFAEKLKAEGIGFIGPNTAAIEAMGDKITSKKIAEKAGVNVIPGHTDVIKDAEEAVRIANRIRYPVMLKASAGGGGKGMRVAYNDEECKDGFSRASSEAASSFGDDRIFIEKFIEQPRHIEIQVIADRHNNVVTLNERECSIQRRHQKVIEEAPSPFIDPDTRSAMSEQAALLARAVDYESAGTVELIVDKEKNFYFLEMNTRLQVEHPVTEAITGVDLIELMIRVAAGEPLPISQADVRIDGWAVETRVYAESPERNFMPSIGRLMRYIPPDAFGDDEGVRIDSGVEEGDEISMFYDPMICKLITHAPSREAAIEKQLDALDRYVIRGVDTNISFLASLLKHPQFRAGILSTHFIDQHYPQGFKADEIGEETAPILYGLLARIHHHYRERASHISGQIVPESAYDTSSFSERCWVVIGDDDEHQTSVLIRRNETATEAIIDGRTLRFEDGWLPGQPLYLGRANGAPLNAQVDRTGVGYTLFHRGLQFTARVLSPEIATLSQHMLKREAPDMSKFLLSPMPGLLVSVAVKPGDKVLAGQKLAIVEAMKMENTLSAEQEGVVKTINATTGETLEVDQVILEFE